MYEFFFYKDRLKGRGSVGPMSRIFLIGYQTQSCLASGPKVDDIVAFDMPNVLANLQQFPKCELSVSIIFTDVVHRSRNIFSGDL